MLKVSPSDIAMNQHFEDKVAAIKQLGIGLKKKSYTKSGYEQGMLEREAQHSTYLGSGIAIPHGTQNSKDSVITTGVTVAHYPSGVDWGDGETVYCAIAIAAKSDEHLDILKQLTRVLSEDGIEERLKNAQSSTEITAILSGEPSKALKLSKANLLTEFPADSFTKLLAVGGGLLNFASHAPSENIVDQVIKSKPIHLGHGFWLTSIKSNAASQISYTGLETPFLFKETEVKALFTLSLSNYDSSQLLKRITSLVFQNQLSALNPNDSASVMSAVNEEGQPTPHPETHAIEATYTIANEHGLHARPGAILVATAKAFDSDIKVENLDGDKQTVNAKSLMKVIALGVKKGHQLRFSAVGSDADEAIKAIGNMIAEKLGEA
ncbi:fused PTS fructose transporter subunit IIA/HPr protein [Vibrio sonorensis]|uniref:fused PTS fructose transporter subunit IIA/HPr protein n=1 Tax=Vibrio sonorensis TaxID=1004316 RepID=UPI0008D9F23D|nr:fused PTS fructose transporter subunit IIA/HPr protein [Vibrio sonorensis]